MEIKTGIKPYSTAPQGSSLKGDGMQRIGAQDKGKVLGDQDLGAMLNKIADPNWVDPTKQIRAVGGNELDKDAFMKLMLTQMKSQDPTSPMDSREMASQLAQFTSLEQLMNINKSIADLKESQKPNTQLQMLNLIGKSVDGDSSKVIHEANDKQHLFEFNLGADASKVIINVKDEKGNTVRTMERSMLKQGKNQISWNGQDKAGVAVPAGDYHYEVEARDANNRKLAVKTAFNGRITGVQFTSSGPVLMVGQQTLRLSDVRKIVDSNLENPIEGNKNTAPDLSNRATSGENNPKEEAEAATTPATTPAAPPAAQNQNNMGEIEMAPQMRKQIEKMAAKTGA